jgi:hypothetical protein
MRAYIRLPLPFAVLVSTLAGCGSGTDSGLSSSDGGANSGFDAPLSSGFDSAPIPGVDSGFAGLEAGSSPGVDSGLEAGSSSGVDSGLDAGSSTGADSAFDTGGSTGVDSGSAPDSSVGADSGSGSDAKADTGTEADSSSDAKAETGSVADSGSDAKADAAADSGTTAGLCNYASGLNVAWVNFANDVPNPDIATFTTIFKNTYAAGGRVIRWWFHTNGTVTPGYQSNGMAQDLPASHVAGVKAILAAAAAQGVAINISLWSFDMLQGSSETISATTTTNNMNLLQVDANRQAYITNYLTPLVTQLKGTPGLYSYEIFNEPEGMTATGWAAYRTTEAYIQTTVNQFAAAIHAADPTPVTNGSQEFQYCSNVAGMTNYYSDSALRGCGWDATGTLDFYEVHYYESNGTSVLVLPAPGVVLEAGQEARHGRVLRGDDRRRVAGRHVHVPLQQRLQRLLGLVVRVGHALAVDAGPDAGPVQRGDRDRR